MKNDKVYIGTAEAAYAIGVSEKTIRGWIDSRRLKAEAKRMPGMRGRPPYHIRHEDLIATSRQAMAIDAEAPTDMMALLDAGANDADALALEIIWPESGRVERLGLDALKGFESLRAATFSASVPAIYEIADGLERLQVEFGCKDLLDASADKIIKLQEAIELQLARGWLGIGGELDPRAMRLMDKQAAGDFEFRALAGGVSHSKIYLLERAGLKRALVGSANLSKQAFSGRQGEVLMAYDNNEFVWGRLERKLDALWNLCTPIEARKTLKPARFTKATDLPTARHARKNKLPEVVFFVPSDDYDAPGSEAAIAVREAELESAMGAPLREQVRAARAGESVVATARFRKINQTVSARQPTAGDAASRLEYLGAGRFVYGGELLRRPEAHEVATDSLLITQYLNALEAFGRGHEELQRNYYALMGWLYFAPFMARYARMLFSADIDAAKRSKDIAIVYGQSNCGKSGVVRFLHRSMFGAPYERSNSEFTPSKFEKAIDERGLSPLVYQDVEDNRFVGSAWKIDQIVKRYDVVAQRGLYPTTVVTTNAEVVDFNNQTRGRALLIYAPVGISGDDAPLRELLDDRIRPYVNRIGTAFYREYLHRMETLMNGVRDVAEFDYLEESTRLIGELMSESLGTCERRPSWSMPQSSNDFNQWSWNLKRLQFARRLDHRHRADDYPPKLGQWWADASEVVLGVDKVRDSLSYNEVPSDWIQQDKVHGSGNLLVLHRDKVEESFKRGGVDCNLDAATQTDAEPIKPRGGLLSRMVAAFRGAGQ